MGRLLFVFMYPPVVELSVRPKGPLPQDGQFDCRRNQLLRQKRPVFRGPESFK